MKWVMGSVLVLSGFGLVVPALAAPGEKASWEVGGFAGFGLLDSYGGTDPDGNVLLGGRGGYFLTPLWSLEGSVQLLSTEADPQGADFDLTSTRVNMLYNLNQGELMRPFVTAGLGFEQADTEAFDETGAGLNVGAGARWYIGQRLGLRLDWRWVYSDVGGAGGGSQNNLETNMGVLWAFGGGPPADTDADGVRDSKDKCPGTPIGAVVDEKGCPKDTDGDGVFDGIDKCPDTQKGCPVDSTGCPTDGDGDGVIDCLDKCAETPRGCTVDATGCPKDEDGDGVCDGVDTCAATATGCTVDASGCPKDEDGDKVCDGVDKCPATAAGCTVDATGCPKDEDGDRVCDGVDKCPGTAAGHKVDEKGCEQLFDERGTLVLEGVTFEYDSAQLTPGAKTVLDQVAASLKEWSDLRVEVGGHTDSKGADAYNQRLSQQRAESVRAYLVGRGLAESRLTAKGYGESQPVADNATEEGRSRNRRVELKRMD